MCRMSCVCACRAADVQEKANFLRRPESGLKTVGFSRTVAPACTRFRDVVGCNVCV